MGLSFHRLFIRCWHVMIPGIILFSLLLASSSAQAQGPITSRFTADGHYATVAGGVGLDGLTSGTITLTVPGTPVAAYLYWSGFDTLAGGGDDEVGFTVDTTLISADIMTHVNGLGDDTATFGPNLWYGSLYRSVYVAEVTDFVLTGTHDYTISGFDMVAPNGVQDGAGLIIVYGSPAEPLSRVTIQDGLSIFFPVSNPPQTFRHSDTACLDFPADTVARSLSYSLFVGGLVEPTVSDPNPRTNALWSYTGTGTSLHNEIPPRNIIDVVNPTNAAAGSNPPIAGAVPVSGVNPANHNDPDEVHPTFGVDYGGDDHNGDQWDTYANTLNIPAGHTFACFQVQTFNLYGGLNGSSGNWMALIGRVPLPMATPPSTSIPPTSVPSTTVPGTPAAGTTPVATVPVAPGTVPQPDDPQIAKVPNPQVVAPGEAVTWDVTITNPTDTTLTGLVVTDPVDATFFSEVVSATAPSSAIGVSINGLNVTYTIPQMQAREVVRLRLVVRTRSDLAPGTVGTNFVIFQRPGRPPVRTAPVSFSVIRRLPETGYPPH